MMNEKVSAVIQASIEKKRLVGAVVLVARDGKIVCDVAEGFFDREAGLPMKPDAIFRIASVTKLYVAVATMLLVAAGKMNLDDTVSKFLPYFKPPAPDGSIPVITIRQLLTHTSGLSYGFFEKEGGPLRSAGVSDGMDSTNISLEENLRRLATVPLSFLPGTAWQYSLAFDVLGAVLEKVEHKSLPDLIAALITNPLALHDTGFTALDRDRLAIPYANAEPEPVRMPSLQRIYSYEEIAPVLMSPGRALQTDAYPSGGAGMVGSPRDTLKLLEALRKGSLLPAKWMAEMIRNQTGDLPIATLPGWNFGLGFSILRDPARAQSPESIGTWRWGGAYGHSWFVDPAQKLSVVAFTNTALEGMSGGGRFPFDLRKAVYDSVPC